MNRLMVRTAGLIAAGLALVWAAGLVPVTRACAADGKMSYAEDIAPVLRGWCVSCHQPGGEGFKKTGLDLTTYQGLMKGTRTARW